MNTHIPLHGEIAETSNYLGVVGVPDYILAVLLFVMGGDIYMAVSLVGRTAATVISLARTHHSQLTNLLLQFILASMCNPCHLCSKT
jgi:hypothetical protein